MAQSVEWNALAMRVEEKMAVTNPANPSRNLFVFVLPHNAANVVSQEGDLLGKRAASHAPKSYISNFTFHTLKFCIPCSLEYNFGVGIATIDHLKDFAILIV